MSGRLPIALGPDLASLAPDVPAEVFDDRFRAACVRLDEFVGALAAETAVALGLAAGEVPDVPELLERRSWNEAGAASLRWLLETLALYGRAQRLPAGWRLLEGDAPSSAALRDAAIAECASVAPAYRVLELSAAALPAVLRGEQRGEEALFGPATLGVWFEYFSNDNPLYAPNNTLTALAAARRTRGRARVLELGGGGGSAALALLAALDAAGKPPARYHFTELHPAFLRRGTRTVQAALPAGCELVSGRLDIDRDPREQGLTEGSYDLIVAVNTVHLATDPVASLAWLRSLLAPDGVLVLGELVRPGMNTGVHLELPFTLLEAYRRAPLVEGMRERPGFLALGGWREALTRAGFARTDVLPATLARCVEAYPGFYCAALTASA